MKTKEQHQCGSEYKKSRDEEGEAWSMMLQVISLLLNVCTFTCDAPSYNWPSASPTARRAGKRLQHTRIEHEPDTPWHLQTRCIRDRSAYTNAEQCIF